MRVQRRLISLTISFSLNRPPHPGERVQEEGLLLAGHGGRRRLSPETLQWGEAILDSSTSDRGEINNDNLTV